jgi:hypothetical protein
MIVDVVLVLVVVLDHQAGAGVAVVKIAINEDSQETKAFVVNRLDHQGQRSEATPNH